MATLIFIWDAPGSKLATWPTATFAVYIAIHGHALRHGPPELYSAIQRYTLYSYTAIQRYTLYNLYNTPLPLRLAQRNTRGALQHVDTKIESGHRLRVAQS